MRRLTSALALAACGAAVLAGCATTGTYLAPPLRDEPAPPLPAGEVVHRVLLTGNTGALETEAVLRAVAADARLYEEDATVVFLGDVTEGGIPPEGAPGYAEAVGPVRAIVDLFEDVESRVVVIPGDRDWALGENGVQRLEDLLDEAFDADVLVPGDQAGGPREWEPAEGLRLIALDTGWWLLDADQRPAGEAEDQSVRTPGDVARILEQIVIDRDDSRIVVLAHHPLQSRGTRAGYRTAGQAALGLGIPALAARTFGLSRQDLAAPGYRQMREVLGRVVSKHDRLVWAAAHDFSLQALRDETSPTSEQVHLVSGTGGGTTAGVATDDALYVAARPGYQRLVYYDNGRLWAEAVEVDPETGEAEVVFRAEVAGPIDELVDPGAPGDVEPDRLPETIGETVTTPLDAGFSDSPRFSNSALTRALFGERYRDVWKTPVDVPVVDVGTEAGGLTPIKRSGGNQTVGLRLQGGDGNLYDFRLLEKGGTRQLPAELRDGLAADVILQLRAAALPYGAVVTAELAEAAGIPTPKPKIVYIPDDPRLGRYQEQFGDRLATLEVRPDEDVSDVPGFEGFTDVISDENLREELREDQDHTVDQRAFLRARLLDMLVADWDRHAGQFRWGAFEPGELDPSLTGEAATQGKVYLPVPRDHDWAFYGIGGLLQPPLFLFDKRLQGIDETYNSVAGLNQSGFPQDRRFLNELTLDDWQAAARSLQADLTDAEIRRSVGVLPASVEALIGEEWTDVLQSRRDRLVDLAETYYALVAGTVDVIGSDERELFEVVRQPGGALEVTVRSYKGGEPGRVLYRRTLTPDETEEVRLYGFAGRDRFEVTGDGPAAIPVRIIAGADDDVLDAPAGRVTVYDTPGGLEIAEHGGDIEDRRSDDPDVNLYDPTERVLGDRQYVPVLGYQATDGFILGAGVRFEVPGFRLRPFAATHTIAANYATTTGGLAASYTGRMREAIGVFNLNVDALASSPRYVRNFYGLGNGTPDVPADLARVDLARAQIRAGLGTPIGQGVDLVVGPTVRYADASAPVTPPLSPPGDEPFPVAPALALPADAFEGQTHGGGFARLELSTANRLANPFSGVRLGAEAAVHAGLSGPAETYGSLGGEIATYLPLGVSPQVTLALRGGAETRIGDFPFFDAAVLGGPGSLRGYRRERFAGRTAASASAELRTKLFDLETYLLPVDVGVLGFADAGRVWADVPTCAEVFGAQTCALADFEFVSLDPDSGEGLQLGYGGGLWFGLLDRAVLNLSVGASDEATLITFGLGFAY